MPCHPLSFQRTEPLSPHKQSATTTARHLAGIYKPSNRGLPLFHRTHLSLRRHTAIQLPLPQQTTTHSSSSQQETKSFSHTHKTLQCPSIPSASNVDIPSPSPATAAPQKMLSAPSPPAALSAIRGLRLAESGRRD